MVKLVNKGKGMKKIFLMIGLALTFNAFGGVVYSNTMDLHVEVEDVKLTSAQYGLFPIKLETRKIPGCFPNGEVRPSDCEEVVVVESSPMIEVSISFEDPAKRGEDNYRSSIVTLKLRPEEFSEAELLPLKKSRGLRSIFSRAGKRFVDQHLTLSVRNVEREITVIDTRNSTFCRIDNDNYPPRDSDCVERIAYKTAKTWVKELTVLKK
jgi:hypothetical protein